MNSFSAFTRLMRPRQWIKNLFVVAPVVFSFSFLNLSKVGDSLIAFVLFCVAASAVYVMNDIFDLPYDRMHPLKKSRPLASGAVSVGIARMIAFLLGAGVLIGSFFFSREFLFAIVAYGILNVLYTVWLKNILLLDILSVALGFVLRVIAGIVAIQVFFSPWILGATFFIALFLIASKRLQESAMVEEDGQRSVLARYSRAFLSKIMFASLVLTITVYMLYAFLEVRNLLFLVTIIPVVYGMFRFLWLIEAGQLTTDNPPDIVFHDPAPPMAGFGFGV